MTYLATAALRRESAPRNRRWARREGEVLARLEQCWQEWQESLVEAEAIFKIYVYENPEAGEIDFRQHRQVLYGLLGLGEEIAVDFLALPDEAVERGRARVGEIDRKLDALRAVLHAWHGNPDDQRDLPESFREGMRDLAEGRTVEMETALRETPAA